MSYNRERMQYTDRIRSLGIGFYHAILDEISLLRQSGQQIRGEIDAVGRLIGFYQWPDPNQLAFTSSHVQSVMTERTDYRSSGPSIDEHVHFSKGRGAPTKSPGGPVKKVSKRKEKKLRRQQGRGK